MHPDPDLGAAAPTATAGAASDVVAVTCADSGLGARVLARLQDDPAVRRVVAIPEAELRTADLKSLLEGVGTVVHVATAAVDPVDPARRLLDAAGDAGIGHLVLVTSALVYGAWPNNPVPLTEDAPLRPNPGFAPAVALGQVERLAAEWRDDHPGATVAVLRPVVAVADDDPGWLAPLLAAVRPVPVGDDDPPGQFVHLDDVATAVALAAARRLDGAFNVAPEGWIPGEELRSLAGGPRLRLPDRIAERVARFRWHAGLSPTPPDLLPWTMHPWVVAGDRLRSEGWVPEQSNAEAFVAGHRPPPWATVSPQRRQELALGATVVLGAGLVAGVVALVRRRLRRR
jgi:nucleoside-diphosphate-sugar epimerase